MAAFERPQTASYEDHETVWVDTEDHEDHTFCGIMFPIKVKKYLPVERILIHSISVRGRLGHLTVHVSNPTETPTDEIPLRASHWTQIYQGKHKMVRRGYCKLELSERLVLSPGDVRLVYVHSTHDGDESIVYDNSSNDRPRYEDNFISIHSGKAHLSPELFGQDPIWGWGNAWRDRREFVGQIAYGVVYKLWDPESHHRFGNHFSEAVQAMLVAQRRYPVGKLPDECLYYIMNMCKWDWFQDTGETLKTKYRTRKAGRGQLQAATTVQACTNGEDAREAWERSNGYRADSRVFQLQAMSSDDEPDAVVEETQPRHRLFHRQVARIRVFPFQMNFAGGEDDDDDDFDEDDDDAFDEDSFDDDDDDDDDGSLDESE